MPAPTKFTPPADPLADDFSVEVSPTSPTAPSAQAAPDAPAALTFRREIDLGDGSGKQVFEASTPDELLDKLVEAQSNATRHIRKLTREATVRRAAVPDAAADTPTYAPKTLDANAEFVLAQSLTTRPSQTISQLIETVTGVPAAKLAEAVNRLNVLEYNYQADKAAMEFVASHAEDYAACPENSEALTQFLTENKLPVTLNNLEFAFETLSHRGVLTSPDSNGTEPAEEPPAQAPPARIERGPSSTRRATGLSGRHTAVASPAPTLSEADLQNLPIDKLRERIVQQQRAARNEARP